MKTRMIVHQLHKLKKEDFQIWTKFFFETVDKLFKGDKAELAKMRTQSVATSIQLNTVYEKNRNNTEMPSLSPLNLNNLTFT
jgi:hypothetical protein|tara:strand:+ start:102997 stop:103242 length:246 start_codon:yes stop_codon:yes gene_type:complete